MNTEHIELVFNGLYDRISGNETYASRYLDGVIWANEPSRMFVSGNEGFLDNVSDGIKKAWEYIKGMFKKIYDWLFSGGSKKKIDEAKKEIKEAEESIKAAQSPPPMTVAETNSMVNKIVDNPGAAQEKETLKANINIDGTSTAPVPPTKVKEVAKKVFDHNLKAKESFKSASKKLTVLREKLFRSIEEAKNEKGPEVAPEGYTATARMNTNEIVRGADRLLSSMTQAINELNDVQNTTEAKTFLTHSNDFIRVIGNNIYGIELSKSTTGKIIKAFEESLYNGNEEDKKLIQPTIDSMKRNLKLCSSIISTTNEFIDVIRNAAKVIQSCAPIK